MTQVIFKPIMRKMNFDNMCRDFPENFPFPFNSFPAIDVIEDKSSLHLFVELPGAKKEDIKIVIEGGTLTLKGEKKKEILNNENINVLNSERKFGPFERKFRLPDDIDGNEVNAKIENGILKITLNKMVPEEPKELIIEVK